MEDHLFIPHSFIIYLVHNNVQFATLTYVDPSTYQIMGNLKIIFSEEEVDNSTMDGNCSINCWNDHKPGEGCGEASCESLFSAPIQGYMLGLMFGAILNMARLMLDDFRAGFENGPW
ncbi:Nucleotide-sugar transporter [Musa troglodytarum]|uniref:Nucleotide-sugar transporter n=1 Tax=Musa troglodytarum TaxID=320322 RepID=A0A9E7GR98_9LILI|nr:Nucleotide-sugar transporter [Musa troglodytarum]